MSIKHFPLVCYRYYRIVIFRRVFEFILFFAFQWIGLHLATGHRHLAPIWFFEGVNTAFIMVRGYRILFPIFLASVLAFWKFGFFKMTVWALLQIGLPWSVVFFSRYFFGAIMPWRQLRARIGFAICAAAVSGIQAAILSCLYPSTRLHGFLFAVFASFLGILMVAPMFFVWTTYIPGQEQRRVQLFIRIASVILALGLGVWWSREFTFSAYGFLRCAIFAASLYPAYRWGGQFSVVLIFAVLGVMLGTIPAFTPLAMKDVLGMQILWAIFLLNTFQIRKK